MVTANTYGQFSAQALQPYPIESTLAQIGYGESPTAAKILGDQFWLERQAHENLYGQELAQQHQFAYDQLRQQLAEAAMKEIPNMGKVAGATEVLAPTMMGLGIGNSDTLTNLAVNAQRAADAQNFAHQGSGLSGYAAGGYITNDPNNPAGGKFSFIGTPGQLRLQGDLARAAAQNQANLPGFTAQGPVGEGGRSTSLTGKLDPRFPLAPQLARYMAQNNALDEFFRTGVMPETEVIPPTPKKVTIGATPPSTNLQPNRQQVAQTDTGGGRFAPLRPGTQEGDAAQVQAMKALDAIKQTNRPAHDKIAPRGGVIPIVKDIDTGRKYVVGADNQKYELQ